MEIIARFPHTTLDHTQENKVPLVVSVKAPNLAGLTKRPQLCVLPLIDLSGSMAGDKIRYAQESLLKLVEQLSDGDYAGLIGFESRIHCLVKPQLVTGELKDQLKGAIRRLTPMGGTNLGAGLLDAVRAVQALDLPATFLKRIIAFTDGQANEGVVQSDQLLKLLDTNRGSVSLSAFGYGDAARGGCDHEFLSALSDTGKGNYAYVQNPDSALSAFGKELGGLLSTYGTELSLEVQAVNGHQVMSLVTDAKHSVDDTTGEVTVNFPDIMCEETRHFVFETVLTKQANAFPRDATAFNLKLSFSMIDGNGQQVRRTIEEKGRVRFVKPADVSKKADPAVRDIVDLHRLVRTQLEAEALAKKGDFKAASNHMGAFGAALQANGNAAYAHVAMQTSGRMADAQVYANSGGYFRTMARGGSRAVGTSSMDADAAEALDALQVSASNSLQEQYMANFTAPVEAPGGPNGPIVVPLVQPSTTTLGLFQANLGLPAMPLLTPTLPNGHTIRRPKIGK